MADFDRIREVKAQARDRLLAIPGVHSIAIGARKVGGKKTTEAALVVFVEKKKPASELTPEEVIPSEIDGVRVDVVEEAMPRLQAFPDEEQYDVLDGGIQVQAGTSVTGLGTLGCIARTDEPEPKIVALTCHHVMALWGAVDFELKAETSRDKAHGYIWGTNVTGVRIQCYVTVKPTGAGSPTYLGPFNYVTTAADTPGTIATNVATLINAAANPNLNATASSFISGGGDAVGDVRVSGVGTFTAEISCELQPMWVDVTGTKVATFNGLVRTGFLAVIHIEIKPIAAGNSQYLDLFYTTVAGDDLHTIATHVAAEINALANPGVTAAGPALPAGTEVTITSGANVTATIDTASVYSPMIGDKDSKLRVAVNAGVITLAGRVAGDDYGIYTNVHVGGGARSYGVFLNPSKDTPLNQIASTIAGNITQDHIPGVTATANGPQITVTGAEVVQCFASSDIRVGQPVNNFGSSCSHCCNRRFGRVIDARLNLDTAVIQIDGGKQYVAEIKDIGLVAGTYAITDADVMTPGSYAVQKRGRTTGKTTGTADYLNAEGNVGGEGIFHRYYNDAIKIAGSPFSAGGDSGSAVLNSAREVVGILFGGGSTYTYATPIQTIANELEVIVQSATNNNPVTVPVPAGAHAMMAPAVPEHDWERLREAELELKSSLQGSEMMEAVRRHIPETQQLIQHNRRFAATWRRYGGPLIVQAVLRMAQRRDEHLPATIKGRPLLTCLRKIKDVLDECASQEFRHDLAVYQQRIEASLRLTYAELVNALQTAEQE